MDAAPCRVLEEEIVAIVVVGGRWKADTTAPHPRRMMQATVWRWSLIFEPCMVKK